MKKLFFLLLTAVLLFACEPSTANAQNITYSFENGNIVIKRSGIRAKTLAVIGTTVDTVQRPTIGYASAYLRFLNNGIVTYTITYAAASDSISGRTAVAASNILNQDLNSQRGNYLGAYTKAQLISADTAVTGKYYYDTDSVSFRVKRASGGFITLQTKN
jgi:hypothetical protein